MPRIVFYITSHGFGHATREIEIINHVPETVDVEIVTAAPLWLFENSVTRAFDYHELRHDVGIIQYDSLHADVVETYRVWIELLAQYPVMVEAEAARLRVRGVNLVVGDVSPFAVVVGKTLGVPSVVVANFSWDWIMADLVQEKPEIAELIARFKEIYNQCDLLLRTPMSGDLSVFPRIQDIPLVVRQSKLTEEEARTKFELDMADHVVLISFGGFGAEQIQTEHLQKYPEIIFLSFDKRFEGLENVRLLDTKKIYHPDVVSAADLVLTKLGYGIVMECIAHQTPIAYPPRTGFPEYQVLEREAPKYVDLIPLNWDDFLGGNWDTLYEALSRRDVKKKIVARPPVTLLNGGGVAAEILMNLVEGAD